MSSKLLLLSNGYLTAMVHLYITSTFFTQVWILLAVLGEHLCHKNMVVNAVHETPRPYTAGNLDTDITVLSTAIYILGTENLVRPVQLVWLELYYF